MPVSGQTTVLMSKVRSTSAVVANSNETNGARVAL